MAESVRNYWEMESSESYLLDTYTAGINQLVLDLVGYIPDQYVLDVGCGKGYLSLRASEDGSRQTVGVDISSNLLGVAHAIAKQRGSRDNLDFVACDATRMPFKEGVFDVILSSETLEHIPNMQKACSEVARVLKKGGRFSVSTPNYFNPLGFMSVLAKRLKIITFDEGYCDHVITPFMLKRVFKKAGLKIASMRSSHLKESLGFNLSSLYTFLSSFLPPRRKRLLLNIGLKFFKSRKARSVESTVHKVKAPPVFNFPLNYLGGHLYLTGRKLP